MVTHGSYPMTHCLAFPFLILWNHAPSQFSRSEHSWLSYLIKMHIYMMSQFNICRMSRHTIGEHSNLKHNITKSMVGIFRLAPHHDYLQYLYHIYLMHQGQNQGVTFRSPFNSTVLSALQNLNKMIH